MDTQEARINSNKLIAEFMEFRPEVNNHFHVRMGALVGINTIVTPEYMNFDFSWDWLMPVIEKIEELGYRFVFTRSNVGFMDGGSPICVVSSSEPKFNRSYEAVVEFIKWHNQKK